MKKLLKWFTLVEILIVIVIIGILIGALVPRMQSAQWRARDVARKNDLAQLQSAILVSFQDKWVYPCQNASGSADAQGCTSDTAASNWLDISSISNLLLAAWMNSVPWDPLKWNIVSWLWSNPWNWQYRYMLVKSNSVANWGFVLMANTEVEWGSNRVVCPGNEWTETPCPESDCVDSCKVDGVCDTTKTYLAWATTAAWGITSDDDTRQLVLCTNLTQGNSCSNDGAGTCTYENETQLRYILTY